MLGSASRSHIYGAFGVCLNMQETRHLKQHYEPILRLLASPFCQTAAAWFRKVLCIREAHRSSGCPLEPRFPWRFRVQGRFRVEGNGKSEGHTRIA